MSVELDAFDDEDLLRKSWSIDEEMLKEGALSAEEHHATLEDADSFEPMATVEINFLLR